MPARIGTTVTSLKVGSTALSKLMYNGASLLEAAADPTAFTPAVDTPVLTYAALSASTNAPASNIAGSAGFQAPKRIGVAEPAVGASQSSSAGLDLTGSTRYAYPMVPSASGQTNFPTYLIETGFKEGDSASIQNARYPFSIDFITSSPSMELRFRAPSATPAFGRLLVNGLRVQQRTMRLSNTGTTVSAGSGYGAKLVFPDARPRRIQAFGLNTQSGAWGGVAVESGYLVEKPTTFSSMRLAIIGDSYANGALTSGSTTEGAHMSETWPWHLGLLLGTSVILQNGIGSSGFLKPATNDASTGTIFRNRIATTMALNPTHVVFAGLRNDQGNYTDAALQAEIEYCLDQVGTGVKRYLMRTSSNSATANAAMAAAGTSRNVPYFNLDVDAVPKIADNIHPTYPGHESIGAQMNTFMRSAGL